MQDLGFILLCLMQVNSPETLFADPLHSQKRHATARECVARHVDARLGLDLDALLVSRFRSPFLLFPWLISVHCC